MAITLAQSVLSGVLSATPYAATFTTANTTIGNIGLCVFWWNGSGTQTTGTISLADTQSNTWSLITGTFAQFSDSSSGNKLGVGIAWCRYSGATKNKVTVTFSQPTTFANVDQLEYSGLVASGSPVDAANSNSVGATNAAVPWTTGNITVANANSLAVGFIVTGGGTVGSGALTAPAGFTLLDNNNTAGFFWCASYNTAIATGSQNSNFSRTGGTAQYGACVASFIPAGTGATTIPLRMRMGMGL